MNVQLKTEYSTERPDEAVAFCARGDHMSDSLVDMSFDDAMDGTPKEHREFLASLLSAGHFGPFEHAQAVFAVEGISRVVMAQATRHRHMSFDVQSLRYTEPETVEFERPETVTDEDRARMQFTQEDAAVAYQRMIENGVEPEDARYALPMGTKVNMTFSANLRSLFHFDDLRDNAKAQDETVTFARAVWDELESWAPKSTSVYREKTNNNSLRAP
ncbi:FAD-dependent thymidylate synthase [Halosegnis longus]|uniref:FAD-dependent thymidylate synthase n=1 Tax=Halosegnis longus TaxID=2216012 RepID=UPI00129D2B03|nr:FAD-dependent thymidylate synthase [Halosegnis longus]